MKIYIVQINGIRIIYIAFFLKDKIFILFLNIKYKINVEISKTTNNVAEKNN